jgi:hypothetical protein
MGHSRKDPRGNFCRPRGSGEKFVSDRVLGHPKRCGGGGGLTGMTQRDYLDHRLVECIGVLLY